MSWPRLKMRPLTAWRSCYSECTACTVELVGELRRLGAKDTLFSWKFTRGGGGMADAADLKSAVGNHVRVRPPPALPSKRRISHPRQRGEQAMQLREALTALGVTDQTLSQAEKDRLDRDGYLPLPDILSAAQIERIHQRTDELIAAEGADAGKEVHQEAGTIRLSDLVNKDPVFEVCFTHPRVLAAIDHVLKGDLKLSSLNFRAALPGHGLQGLHADWGTAV